MSDPSKIETYVSVDTEANGPIPGVYSMLSLGAAAFDLTKNNPRQPIATFEVNLEPLPEAAVDADTMLWWAKNPEAWQYVQTNQMPPESALRQFAAWLDKLPGKLVFVGYPASYDQMFVHWYMIRFVGTDPLGFSGIDLKTLAMALLLKPYRSVSKREMPELWFEGAPPHTHKALEDAVGQGILFVNMMRELRRGTGRSSS